MINLSERVTKPLPIRRYLLGKLSVRYHRTTPLTRLSFHRYWGNRLFYLCISRVDITLDCRLDVWADITTGVVK